MDVYERDFFFFFKCKEGALSIQAYREKNTDLERDVEPKGFIGGARGAAARRTAAAITKTYQWVRVLTLVQRTWINHYCTIDLLRKDF